MTTKNQTTAEFAHDIQTGLARHSVPEYEQLPLIGMAASLALHIRGLGEIDYVVMKPVADSKRLSHQVSDSTIEEVEGRKADRRHFGGCFPIPESGITFSWQTREGVEQPIQARTHRHP